MRRAVFIPFILVAGCAPDFGPDLGPNGRSATGDWPDLMTAQEIAGLSGFDQSATDEMTMASDDLAERAAALRQRAAALARASVMSGDERRMLQTASAAGQP